MTTTNTTSINTSTILSRIINNVMESIASVWFDHGTKDKYSMMRDLLLTPESFCEEKCMEKYGNYFYSDWNMQDGEDGVIHTKDSARYEMTRVLLDIMYDEAGEYAKRTRPAENASDDMETYEKSMLEFWIDVPQSVKEMILFGDALITAIECGFNVGVCNEYVDGINIGFIYAMNKVMTHHLTKIGEIYFENNVGYPTNPLNKVNPARVSQIENFIDAINKCVIQGFCDDAIIGTIGVDSFIIEDAWIDDGGICFFCSSIPSGEPSVICIPINEIGYIHTDGEGTYSIPKTDGKEWEALFVNPFGA